MSRRRPKARRLAVVAGPAGSANAGAGRPPRSRRLLLAAAAILGIAGVAIGLATSFAARRPERLREAAEAATRAGDWPRALEAWRALNQTRLARGRTYFQEARACLALGRADDAEHSLRQAVAADPSDPDPWLLALQICRIEDRQVDALDWGWRGYVAVPASSRAQILRDLTLALLAEPPDDIVLPTLDRWVEADPNDANARVAQLRRGASGSRGEMLDPSERIQALAAILAVDPANPSTREDLFAALADSGRVNESRNVLESWPEATRDVRYLRLRGRRELDFEDRPEPALRDFETTLRDLPHDWKTRSRAARALRRLGRNDQARAESNTVLRLLETLDPARLGPRLDQALNHLDNPASSADLAALCERLGLERLAEAWRLEARRRAATAAPTPLQTAIPPE